MSAKARQIEERQARREKVNARLQALFLPAITNTLKEALWEEWPEYVKALRDELRVHLLCDGSLKVVDSGDTTVLEINIEKVVAEWLSDVDEAPAEDVASWCASLANGFEQIARRFRAHEAKARREP